MIEMKRFENQKSSSATSPWAGLARFILQLSVFVFLVTTFGFQAYSIPSGSMESTLLVGDRIIVTKYAYGYSRYSSPLGSLPISGRIFASQPKRGDVVVFRLPRDPSIVYVKRVIGLPGDTVQLRAGVLYVNGRGIPKKFIGEFEGDGQERSARVALFEETLPNGARYNVLDAAPADALDNTSVFRVPAGKLFMLGDNRDNSADSRLPGDTGVGFVPIENVVGRADLIFASIGPLAGLDWRWHQVIRWSRFLRLLK
jgi:signal peptidase I